MKTPGQIAYETWVTLIPRYPDLQYQWNDLSQQARDGWEMIAQAIRTQAATEWITAR